MSIILGAFGAHYFSEILTEKRFDSLKTGINYQMYMGLGLIALSSLREKFNSKTYKAGSTLIILGTFMFCFSIYGLVYLGHNAISSGKGLLGPTTPLGGTLLIIGWFILLISLFSKSSSKVST